MGRDGADNRDDLQHGESDQSVRTGPYFDNAGRAFDVSADGQRFLMIEQASKSGQNATVAPSLVVVEHWTEELKARVPPQ